MKTIDFDIKIDSVSVIELARPVFKNMLIKQFIKQYPKTEGRLKIKNYKEVVECISYQIGDFYIFDLKAILTNGNEITSKIRTTEFNMIGYYLKDLTDDIENLKVTSQNHYYV